MAVIQFCWLVPHVQDSLESAPTHTNDAHCTCVIQHEHVSALGSQ